MNCDKINKTFSSLDLEHLKVVFTELDSSLAIRWNDHDKFQENQVPISFSNLCTLDTDKNVENLNSKSNKKFEESFESYVEKLQLGYIADVPSCEETQLFLVDAGLIQVILNQKTYNRKLSNHLIKLHDIISNAFHGKIEFEYLIPSNIAKRVIASLLFCHLIQCSKEKIADDDDSSVKGNYAFLAPTIATALTNYTYYEDVLKSYVIALSKLCAKSYKDSALVNNTNLIYHLSSNGKECFFKTILKYSENSEMVCCIINQLTKVSSDILFKILISRASFGNIVIYKRLVCTLSRFSTEKKDNNIGVVLIKVMQAWADPVIARAHVSSEIIHYTHLVFVLFYHLVSNKHLVHQYQQKIVEHIAKGLPNHLNSTDFRTVSLAKMMCELITESLKFYTGLNKGETLNESFIHNYLGDYLCKEILEGYENACCEAASKFWMSKYSVSNMSTSSINVLNKTADLAASEVPIDSDDDDDDDLKPIESMDAPNHDDKTKIVYIRDFLEKLPELKTYDDTAMALKNLPNVIKHQLIYDHEQVGRDILDAMFRWENDFDQPILDDYRKNNLCTILKTKTEGNVDHFCKYFHGLSQLQPYKKNLILDVLSTVSKDISLKQLGILANSAFHHILYDENCIKTQDVTVKIPLILFFSNLLSNTLPKLMVKEEMVISYLRCLTQIEGESASTEQTALYAIHNLVGSLEGFQFSENVQSSISDTRTWLCRLQNMEINHL